MSDVRATAPGPVERIRAASRRPASLGSVPDGAVSLALGEPFGGTPDVVVEAAVAALRAGRTRYAAFTGSPSLREALAVRLTEESGVDIGGDRVVPTHGGSAGLAATILSLVGPGDRVVLPEPTYSLYADHVALAGGVVDWVPAPPGSPFPIDELRSALRGARLVVLCNPSNPTGQVLSAAQVRTVVEAAAEAGARVLVDEAYGDLVLDDADRLAHRTATSLLAAHDHVVCVGTFSKSYAMTGWRIGWVAAADDLARRIDLVHRTFNGPVATFVQDAAEAALALPAEHLERLRAAFRLRRDVVVARLAEVEQVTLARPRGAVYAFPHLETDLPTTQLAAHFAAAGVLVRDGAEFGPSGAGHVRLSYATDLPTLHRGLDRFATAAATL